MSVLLWVGFIVGMVVLMIISRWSLWAGFLAGAIIIAAVGLSVLDAETAIDKTVTDPGMLCLALAVSIIPLIGGVLERSGLIDDLVQNLRMKRKAFLAFAPALLGTIPMPGGALLSAPLVKRGGKGVPRGLKSGINVWFREVIFMIYPLSPDLIVSSTLAVVSIFVVMAFLSPFFLLAVFLGWFFLLRHVRGEMKFKGKRDAMKLATPFFVLLIAPVIYFAASRLLPLPVPEVALLSAVTLSLVLALILGHVDLRGLGSVAMKMRPWNFGLIIVFMYLLVNIFKATEIPQLIGDMRLSPTALLVVGGFLLAFVTGRIILPASIIIPIYLVQHGTMGGLEVALFFYGTLQGYVLTPVHPCVAVTIEYFKTSYKAIAMRLLGPTMVSLAITIIISLVLLG